MLGAMRRAVLPFICLTGGALAGCGGPSTDALAVADGGASEVLMHGPPGLLGDHCTRRERDPGRTVVERPCGTPLAVLTDGARTAIVFGPERTFTEATAPAPVTSRVYVRLLPTPHEGGLSNAAGRWLEMAAAAPAPDLLEHAMQYVAGAPALFDAAGLKIAGDASYGPLTDAGVRLEGSDFNDYLGIRWSYPGGTVDRPEPAQLGSLDCSGYIRMLWGYRGKFPLAPGPTGAQRALARRAVEMDASLTGVVILAGAPPVDLGRLSPGDLLFFDADQGDGPAIDHVGIYLGLDAAGHHRFVSSRKTADGPTLGDVGGASILDGGGLYARSFRSARRL